MGLLFDRQHEWGARHDGSAPTSKEKELLNIISSLPGINIKQLQEDMKNPAIDRLIENDKKDGTLAGVTGTPTLFVNGKIIAPLSLDTMIERIEAGLK
jgi:protein-disulfide isomerase